MKKMIVVTVCMAMAFAIVSMASAQTPILKSSMISGQEICKVYTLGRGTLQINCAEKTATASLTNVLDYSCPTVGNKQVCTNKTSGKVVSVNPYDVDAIKCQKVCGPSTGAYTFAK
jgi:hypothetical protein